MPVDAPVISTRSLHPAASSLWRTVPSQLYHAGAMAHAVNPRAAARSASARVLDTAADLFYAPRRARGRHGRARAGDRLRQGDRLPAVPHQGRAHRRLPAPASRPHPRPIDADIAGARTPAGAVRAIFAAIDRGPRASGRSAAARSTTRASSSPTPAIRRGGGPGPTAPRCTIGCARSPSGSRPGEGDQLGDQLALLIDGMYTSAAHLGPAGPRAAAPAGLRVAGGRPWLSASRWRSPRARSGGRGWPSNTRVGVGRRSPNGAGGDHGGAAWRRRTATSPELRARSGGCRPPARVRVRRPGRHGRPP